MRGITYARETALLKYQMAVRVSRTYRASSVSRMVIPLSQQTPKMLRAPSVSDDSSDAPKLRTIADELFASSPSGRTPNDILSLDHDRRSVLARALHTLADDLGTESDAVELEIVSADASSYSVDESRDIFYLVRTALEKLTGMC
jgi:hypothetical protein